MKFKLKIKKNQIAELTLAIFRQLLADQRQDHWPELMYIPPC